MKKFLIEQGTSKDSDEPKNSLNPTTAITAHCWQSKYGSKIIIFGCNRFLTLKIWLHVCSLLKAKNIIDN